MTDRASMACREERRGGWKREGKSGEEPACSMGEVGGRGGGGVTDLVGLLFWLASILPLTGDISSAVHHESKA